MKEVIIVRNPYRYAQLVTVDNIKQVESWCKGDIKGTALPVSQQVIEVAGEDRAEIGDWVVEVVPNVFGVITARDFSKYYMRVVDDSI